MSSHSSLQVHILLLFLLVLIDGKRKRGTKLQHILLLLHWHCCLFIKTKQEELYRHICSVVPEGCLPVSHQGIYSVQCSLVVPIDISRCSSPYSSYCCHFKDTATLSTCKQQAKVSCKILPTTSTPQVSLVLKEAAEDCIIPTNIGRSLAVLNGPHDQGHAS